MEAEGTKSSGTGRGGGEKERETSCTYGLHLRCVIAVGMEMNSSPIRVDGDGVL